MVFGELSFTSESHNCHNEFGDAAAVTNAVEIEMLFFELFQGLSSRHFVLAHKNLLPVLDAITSADEVFGVFAKLVRKPFSYSALEALAKVGTDVLVFHDPCLVAGGL